MDGQLNLKLPPIVLRPGDKVVPGGIFLAGPTPRSAEVKSWRPEAVVHLHNLGYFGTVYVPEREDWVNGFDYMDQILWEWEALDKSSVIAFWVPRAMGTMPGLTTNVEFGLYINSYKVVYGRPTWACHTSYLDALYRKVYLKKPACDLLDLMKEAVKDESDFRRFCTDSECDKDDLS